MEEERTGKHHVPGMLVRPATDRRKAGEEILKKHGWTMTEFVDACLAVLAENPDGLLKRLAKVRQSRPRGRPRKST